MDAVSLAYFPVAVGLGALHALEPGHAKTMTAAYLIGIRGTWRDAVLLGLSAAATHSVVVIGIAVIAVLIGRQAFAGEASWWLQVGSGAIVILLGSWMLWRRLARRRYDDHDHGHDDDHDDHHDDDDSHARAHAAQVAASLADGVRPTRWQVVLFGAAGGLVPCPASISVMLLAITIGTAVNGVILVGGFSIGLAAALVGVGLLVVAGAGALSGGGRLAWFSRHAGELSAVVVILSGIAALVVGLVGGGHASSHLPRPH